MSSRKYDYAALEREFVQDPNDISVRALAEKHGIPWSGLNVQANKGNWRQKREDFKRQAMSKAVERASTDLAEKITEIRRDALDAIHAAIIKMGLDMQDRQLQDGRFVPGQVITPSDVAKLIDKMLLLTGNPTSIGEERHIGVNLPSELPPELARLIADTATERGADTGTVGRSPLPGSGIARKN